MESEEVVVAEDGGVLSGNVDGFEVVGCSENGNVDLGDEIMVNLDSYLDDINDRLVISRVVSESVIRGIVKAVEEEAAKKIEAKEQEVAFLKRFLQFRDVGSVKPEFLGSSFQGCQGYMSFEEACSMHNKVMESLVGMRNVAREELNTFKKRASCAGCSSVRRIGSGSELVGLGGILQEKEHLSCVSLDGTLDSVRRIVDDICSQASASLRLSKSLLFDWHWERDFQREIEAFVMQTSNHTIQEQVEQKHRCQSAQLSSSESSTTLKNLDQISSLREELDAILKSLSNTESSQLISHGSHDADYFHRKLLSSHPSTSVWEGNGIPEASTSEVPENFEFLQLKHLSREGLFSFFTTMIMKMRRNHESTVQQLTEEYFSLKREYFKERGSLLPHKKDKEFDTLRKKISEIIMKLGDVVAVTDKVPVATNDSGDFSTLEHKLDILVSENSELRDSLRDKENELKRLSSQLSDASVKVSQQSSSEKKLLQIMGKLESDLEDAHIEGALKEDMWTCIVQELIGNIRCNIEESDMESILKQEIYDIVLNGAAVSGQTAVSCDDEDSEVESTVMQGLLEVITMEALKDAGRRMKKLATEYMVEQQKQTLLDLKASEMENELRLVAESNERMKHETSVLTELLEDKEKIATEVSAVHRQDREQLELVSGELSRVQQEANQQRALVFECSKELASVKDKLTEALKQTESDKMKIQELNQNLENSYLDTDEQKRIVAKLSQEKHDHLQLLALKEKELSQQLEMVALDANELLKTFAIFQFEVSGKIKNFNLRLEDSFSQLTSLVEKAKSVTRTGLKYKKILERKCADLEMAEAEVDLLGDEVDMVLSLLEKIYTALKHYSPVLQHYPGITEILKLMKRELSGEAIKLL